MARADAEVAEVSPRARDQRQRGRDRDPADLHRVAGRAEPGGDGDVLPEHRLEPLVAPELKVIHHRHENRRAVLWRGVDRLPTCSGLLRHDGAPAKRWESAPPPLLHLPSTTSSTFYLRKR